MFTNGATSAAASDNDLTFGPKVNELLTLLSDKISEDECQTIKAHLQGYAYFGSFCEVTTARDLFALLISRGLLSTTNLDLLKEILMILRRTDIIKDVLAQLAENPPEPVDSSDQLSFFGQVTLEFDVDEINMETVESVRMKISNLALVPLSAVLVTMVTSRRVPPSFFLNTPHNSKDSVNEIETCSYPVVTLSLPRLYIAILGDRLTEQNVKFEISSLGAQSISLGGSVIELPTYNGQRLNDKVEYYATSAMNNHASRLPDRPNSNEDAGRREDTVVKLQKENRQLEERIKSLSELEERLAQLHRYSGMSTTLWKVTGRLDTRGNEPQYKPCMTQEELRTDGVYQRLARVFPQITYKGKPVKQDWTMCNPEPDRLVSASNLYRRHFVSSDADWSNLFGLKC